MPAEAASPAAPSDPPGPASNPAPEPASAPGEPAGAAEPGGPAGLPPEPMDATLAALQGDPANNPVERGLHELGLQIEEAERNGGAGGGDGGPGGGDGGAGGDDGGSGGGDGGGRSGPAHAAPKKKRSTRRKVGYVLGSIFLVLVLIAGAAAGYGWYLNHEIHRIDLHNLRSTPDKGDDAGTENILMIGSTHRCALTVQNPAYGLCSQGVNGVNSDVVMILHLNPANSLGLDPLHPARPLRPQRPVRRGQQDRRRAVPGARSADRRHRRGLRDPDPALRRAELRQLHQRGELPGRHQDVLPRAGLRRLLGAEHPDDGLHPAQRDAGAPGRAGPPPPVQGPPG